MLDGWAGILASAHGGRGRCACIPLRRLRLWPAALPVPYILGTFQASSRLDAGRAGSHARRMHLEDDGRYVCPSCGEEVVVPVDASAGDEQEYVEDCPVCCAPVLLSVRVAADGEIRVDARCE